MPRSTNNVAAKKRRKKVLDSAKGYFGGKSKLYRTAKLAVEKSGLYAYRDRKVRKREFRKLWIVHKWTCQEQHPIKQKESCSFGDARQASF